mgnify:CR=1 FL=1
MEPAWKDFSKRATKGEPKAIQFGIDLKKDFRKERGLGKRAERVTGASGGKKTGTLGKGNLSFPGDRTGAYSTTKSQIEFNKALKKARGGTEGDIPREAPKDVKDYAKGVRDKRIKKLKLPDTSFDAKPSKKPIKPFGNKKVTTSAPGFGKGDTPGQQKVKAMDIKAFKVTQPSDIKKTKGFKPFAQLSKDIKDLKKGTRNISSMNPSEMERAFGTSSTEGSAGASGSSRTTGVNQADVSRRAKKFSQNIELIKGDTRVTLQKVPLSKIDFVFLDGGHSYDTVKSDLQKLFDSMKNNSKIVCDDFAGITKIESVEEAIKDFANNNKINLEEKFKRFALLNVEK